MVGLNNEKVFPTVRNAWRSCQHPSQATLRSQFSNTCPGRRRQSFPLTDSLLSSSPDHLLTTLFLHNFFLFHYKHYRTFLLGVKRLPSAFSCFHHLLFSTLPALPGPGQRWVLQPRVSQDREAGLGRSRNKLPRVLQESWRGIFLQGYVVTGQGEMSFN